MSLEGSVVFKNDGFTAAKNGKPDPKAFRGVLDESLDILKLAEVYDRHKSELDYDMLIVNTDRIQVLMINFKQQIRPASSPDAGDDLDHPVLFLGYQLIQILLSFDHGKPPHASKIRIYTFLSHVAPEGQAKIACPFSIGTIPKNTAV